MNIKDNNKPSCQDDSTANADELKNNVSDSEKDICKYLDRLGRLFRAVHSILSFKFESTSLPLYKTLIEDLDVIYDLGNKARWEEALIKNEFINIIEVQQKEILKLKEEINRLKEGEII